MKAIFKIKNQIEEMPSSEKKIVLLLLIMVVVVLYFCLRCHFSHYATFSEELESWHQIVSYRQQCDALCDQYIDSDFNPQEALAYCEKYYEIDLNENGNIPEEVGMLNAFGVSEDRVYCFNIRECSWGPSRNSRLTPKKCSYIMCDVYTERYKGNQTAAAALIKTKIPFGESTEPYHEDLLVLDMNSKPILDREGKIMSTASWWIDNFQDVECIER